ncbi:MAG: Ig-like domain-containing protein [Spirochaetes bacterium]|nr:Ig-like domain-containing protein [Spirochaetota bacterium]
MKKLKNYLFVISFFFIISCSISHENPSEEKDDLDTTKPVLKIVNPEVNAIVTSDPVLIQADAFDDKAIASVEFYNGTTLLAIDREAPYEHSWNLFIEDNGDHTLKVKAIDTSGNTTMNEVEITVSGIESVHMPVPNVFMDIFPQHAILSFSSDTAAATIYTGVSSHLGANEPDSWIENTDISLANLGTFKIFAKAEQSGLKDSAIFSEIITISDGFPPAAGQPGSDAIAMTDTSITGWATGFTDFQVGSDCAVSWQTPDKALGPAVGTSFDIVCLGNGGKITMTFASPITNGDGPDFCIFENSFSDTFLELAYVEVSSNGTDFLRFDCVSLTSNPVGAFGTVQPRAINGLAGRYKQGYGNPFDLSWLKYRDEVRNGTVDLSSITHVRIVDIRSGNDTIGNECNDYDSFGNKIYDPYKCTGSGGFDLDAIGVLH